MIFFLYSRYAVLLSSFSQPGSAKYLSGNSAMPVGRACRYVFKIFLKFLFYYRTFAGVLLHTLKSWNLCVASSLMIHVDVSAGFYFLSRG